MQQGQRVQRHEPHFPVCVLVVTLSLLHLPSCVRTLKEDNKVSVALALPMLAVFSFEVRLTMRGNGVALYLVLASLSDKCPEGLVEHPSSQYCQGNTHVFTDLIFNSEGSRLR